MKQPATLTEAPRIQSKWVYLVLVVCGLLSTILALLAYPPAEGADGRDYFLHAAVLAGEEAPVGFALHPPLLPLLILLFRHGLHQIYGLILLQAVFSVVQGVLFYKALQHYNRRLAFVIAVLISFDMQTKVMNNFISTESPYIFLLSVAFCLLCLRMQDKRSGWLAPQDWSLGSVLALLFFTRAVGRLLIVPFGLSFLLFTRSWRRSLVLILAYFLSMQVFYFIYGGFININDEDLAGINSDEQWSLPLFRGQLLDAENGAASAELVTLASHCAEQIPVRCMIELNGQDATLSLISRALRETLIANPFGYGLGVLRHFSQFLSLSSRQYHTASPAEAQCADSIARSERNFQTAVEQEWLSLSDSDVNLEAFRQTVNRLTGLMCPPWVDSDGIRVVVDGMSRIYDIFALRRAYIVYGLLLLAILILPYARPYLEIVLPSMLILFYHAGISSLIYNVQARYVAVVHTYRILLFVVFAYLLFVFLKRLIQTLSKTRRIDFQAAVRKNTEADRREDI